MKANQSARMEDYLEAIYTLSMDGEAAQVSTIGKQLAVSMPTVCSAIGKLSARGLVKHEKYKDVKLTKKGREVAEDVYHRHLVLTRFFTEILGVDPETSRHDACEIEHSLSPETDRRLTSFVEFVLEAPGRPEWLDGFSCYYRSGKRPEACGKKWERA